MDKSGMRNSKILSRGVVAASVLSALYACGGGEVGADGALSGSVEIDGSSTVFPVLEAVAEEFQIQNPSVLVTVGVSGTGGGFKRFCNGETDISNASRPIKDTEIEECARNGVEFTEVPVAWDGLSVVVNPDNDFAQCLTVDELRRIWEPGSQVSLWSDVREGMPEEEISLYGADVQSGTFDYFTEAIMGEGGASRPDYQASADDNVLVQGVNGDRFALGYFGYAYVVENSGRLGVVAVDGGAGCIAPNSETIENGTYSPLSRPLFVYVKHEALQRPEVKAYMEFLLANAGELIPPTGYVPLNANQYEDIRQTLDGVAGAED